MELGQWVDGDLYDGRIVRVANSFVFKEPVFNYSADCPFLWDEIRVPVRHGGDPKLARWVIEQAAQEVVGDYVATAAAAWRDMVRKYVIEDAGVPPSSTRSSTTTGWSTPCAMWWTTAGAGRRRTRCSAGSSS